MMHESIEKIATYSHSTRDFICKSIVGLGDYFCSLGNMVDESIWKELIKKLKKLKNLTMDNYLSKDVAIVIRKN